MISTSRRNFLKAGAAVPAAAAAQALVARQSSAASTPGCGPALPRIVVHPEGHYLCGTDGSPFFWLGDTAWQLIQQTTRDECSYYLHTRARQGFTVIQAVVLAEFGGVKEPTAEGLAPVRGPRSASPQRSIL